MRRIFIAISISPKLQQEILAWEKAYRQLPVRWLAGKNLHITLIPPWYTDNVESVIEKLRNLEMKTFHIEFDRVTYGPDSKRPRLIWAEGKAFKEILELKSCLEKILNKKPEKRQFTLHLTVARFHPETFSSFPAKQLDERVLWQEKIKSFVLMESYLSREGADYEVLYKFTLN